MPVQRRETKRQKLADGSTHTRTVTQGTRPRRGLLRYTILDQKNYETTKDTIQRPDGSSTTTYTEKVPWWVPPLFGWIGGYLVFSSPANATTIVVGAFFLLIVIFHYGEKVLKNVTITPKAPPADPVPVPARLSRDDRHGGLGRTAPVRQS